ncbi:MAG: hypothetical protein RLZZ500_1175 [Bacteroidota bacterium]|jgi:hypothetical protein
MTLFLCGIVLVLIGVVIRLIYTIQRLKVHHTRQMVTFHEAIKRLNLHSKNLQSRIHVNSIHRIDFKPISDEIVTLQKMVFQQLLQKE